MKEKTKVILMNILLNIIFYGLLIIIAYYSTPLHEIFHYLPCKFASLSPEMSRFQVICNGIAEKSNTIQFFYFIGPYIFYSFIIIVLYRLSNKYFYIKYLIPIPIFDVVFNYMSSLHESDFGFLIQNTRPSKIPFIISMVLVILVLIVTIRAYFKYRIFSFTEIIKKYLLSKRK